MNFVLVVIKAVINYGGPCVITNKLYKTQDVLITRKIE